MLNKDNRPQKSYSQSGEDRIIHFIFKALKINNFSYLDIGAHHPYKYNNTALFYNQGLKGINIEPSIEHYNLLKKYRKNDTNLNMGVSDKKGKITYFEFDLSTLNTFSKTEAKRYENQGFKLLSKKTVLVDKVSNIIKDHHNNIFPDLLSIDVEGFEEKIINSIDFHQNYPKIICAETIKYGKNSTSKKNNSLISLIQKKGYKVYADAYINTIFIKNKIKI